MVIRPNFAPRRVIALAAIGSALALSGCGSSSKPGDSASAVYSQGVKYADCMRSDGVPSFPDPAPGGGFPLRTSGINFNSPAVVSAQKSCASLQPGGPPPPITGEQIQQMVAKARCIRRHGFPNFPDPGPNSLQPPNWNIEAPASIAARKACARVGIPIPGWGAAWFGP